MERIRRIFQTGKFLLSRIKKDRAADAKAKELRSKAFQALRSKKANLKPASSKAAGASASSTPAQAPVGDDWNRAAAPTAEFTQEYNARDDELLDKLKLFETKFEIKSKEVKNAIPIDDPNIKAAPNPFRFKPGERYDVDCETLPSEGYDVEEALEDYLNVQPYVKNDPRDYKPGPGDPPPEVMFKRQKPKIRVYEPRPRPVERPGRLTEIQANMLFTFHSKDDQFWTVERLAEEFQLNEEVVKVMLDQYTMPVILPKAEAEPVKAGYAKEGFYLKTFTEYLYQEMVDKHESAAVERAARSGNQPGASADENGMGMGVRQNPSQPYESWRGKGSRTSF